MGIENILSDAIKICEDNNCVVIQLYEDRVPTISVKRLQSIAETICMIRKGSVNSKIKGERIVFARWLLWDYLKKTTDLSLAKIGSRYGNKNHATVLYGIDKINNERFFDWRHNFKVSFEDELNNLHKKLDIKIVY